MTVVDPPDGSTDAVEPWPGVVHPRPEPFGTRLATLAREVPERTALVFVPREGPERAIGFAELDDLAVQSAHAMARRGVGEGDRVALVIGNSPELVVGILATWKLGAVPVPVRWDLPDWELDRLVEVIDPTLAIREADAELIARRATGTAPPPAERTPPHTHGICSSGSTGTPKVIVVHRPGVWAPETSQAFASAWLEVPRPQVVLGPAPLYHTNGFACMTALLTGDTVVLMEKFDAARVVELIERHRVTTFTATPTMLQRIADVPGIAGRDLSSLVWVLQGAAAIPPSLVERWIDLIGADHLFMAYGMTESLGLVALSGAEWSEHRGSVGKGLRDTELRVLDERLRELPAGEVGEIFLRWPMGVTAEYLGAQSRVTTTPDGFATVGDMGWLDEGGYLYIADRRVDMIVTGGANVYPAEVETALIEHPGIDDVVVIGLADPEWGRRVHAIVAPVDPADPPTEAEVIAFAKSRIASYKAPKTVEIIDEIPRSAATKVNRGALVAERETAV
jgi:bile acid-coenzyme A ligase